MKITEWKQTQRVDFYILFATYMTEDIGEGKMCHKIIIIVWGFNVDWSTNNFDKNRMKKLLNDNDAKHILD